MSYFKRLVKKRQKKNRRIAALVRGLRNALGQNRTGNLVITSDAL